MLQVHKKYTYPIHEYVSLFKDPLFINYTKIFQIHNNTARQYGGGIYADGNYNLEIVNVDIRDNSATLTPRGTGLWINPRTGANTLIANSICMHEFTKYT